MEDLKTKFKNSDRIVWVNEDGKPKSGTVRWVGAYKTQFMIGIEFDHPDIPNAIGIEKSEIDKRFFCKFGTGRLMPPESLLHFREYRGNVSNSIQINKRMIPGRRTLPNNDINVNWEEEDNDFNYIKQLTSASSKRKTVADLPTEFENGKITQAPSVSPPENSTNRNLEQKKKRPAPLVPAKSQENDKEANTLPSARVFKSRGSLMHIFEKNQQLEQNDLEWLKIGKVISYRKNIENTGIIFGFVRWIGLLGGKQFVGIEFDKPIFDLTQEIPVNLFTCRKNCGVLIALQKLLFQEEFELYLPHNNRLIRGMSREIPDEILEKSILVSKSQIIPEDEVFESKFQRLAANQDKLTKSNKESLSFESENLDLEKKDKTMEIEKSSSSEIRKTSLTVEALNFIFPISHVPTGVFKLETQKSLSDESEIAPTPPLPPEHTHPQPPIKKEPVPKNDNVHSQSSFESFSNENPPSERENSSTKKVSDSENQIKPSIPLKKPLVPPRSRTLDQFPNTSRTEKVPEEIPPPIDFNQLVNKLQIERRGIQGMENSCNVDTVIFCLFAFTDKFDKLLLDPNNNETSKLLNDTRNQKEIEREYEGRKALTKIVTQLRQNYVVGTNAVLEFRKILDKLNSQSSDTFIDIEETLFMIFNQLYDLECFIQYEIGTPDYIHQVILPETFRQPRISTTQKLFEISIFEMESKLINLPTPAFILELPYETGKFVLPNLTLELNDAIAGNETFCGICSEISTIECFECFDLISNSGVKSTRYCTLCDKQMHSHSSRKSHKRKTKGRNLNLKGIDGAKCNLDLFAIICTRMDHFVSFVRCGIEQNSPWVYFDSDPAGGKSRMETLYNFGEEIHKLTQDPDGLDEKWNELPKLLQRMLTDINVCIYLKSN